MEAGRSRSSKAKRGGLEKRPTPLCGLSTERGLESKEDKKKERTKGRAWERPGLGDGRWQRESKETVASWRACMASLALPLCISDEFVCTIHSTKPAKVQVPRKGCSGPGLSWMYQVDSESAFKTSCRFPWPDAVQNIYSFPSVSCESDARLE
jgi:hypothetical protein